LPSEKDNRNVTQFSSAAHTAEWFDIGSLALGTEHIDGMVVRSAEMRKVLKAVARFGPYKTTVVVCGESGTGKELVARALHILGPAPQGPFVTFNCSNLVASLAESQLFGHVRGAFTDARENSVGYFRSANNGTLFLDEIGELPLPLQPKLLRAVELHEIQPVGATQSYGVNIRLIAATNRDLSAMVKAGQFRDDLYYRLSGTAITIPPLRHRRDDIGALTTHFIAHYNRLFGKNVRFISSRAMALLIAYDWPGNVREFSNMIQNAVLHTDSDRLDATALPEHVAHAATNDEVIAQQSASTVRSSDAPAHASETEAKSPLLLDAAIKKTLMQSLEEAAGDRREAASLLGVSRSTIYRMLKRYQLPVEHIRHISSETASVLTVKDLCSYLKLDQSRVYRLIESGNLPAFKVGSEWRFNVDDIDRWRLEGEKKHHP
jgi:excisionase family DNA binding protein